MMPNLIKKLSIPALLLSVTLACSTLAPATPQPVETLNALYTSVAATLDSLSTPTETPQVAEPTATPFLSFPTTSSTPFTVNTITSIPPTQTAIKCDAAAFVA
ncbi:MAG TPA: hypothetical protein PLM89_02770, partial [Anaerolineales bacterium]|nr:hypothetical protein [Anaerolineales bacterium]